MAIWVVYAGLVGLLLLCGPAIALVHELGHALAARLLTGSPVKVFVGSYGDEARSLRLPLGPRSRLYVFRNPLRWARGLCVPGQPLRGYPALLMVVAGPVLPAVLAAGLVTWAFQGSSNDLLRVWSLLLVISAVLSMLFNLRNNYRPVVLHDGTVTYNDGAQLQALWQHLRLPASYRQALAEYDQGNYAAAARGLVPHLPQRHNQADTIRRAVSALLLTKQYAQAAQVLHQYRSAYEATSDDLVNEGVLHVRLGDFAAAFACYEQALALDPANSMAFNNRGYSYLRAQQYEAAAGDFRQALVLNPEFAYSYANLGLALLMLGQPEQGLGHIHTSLQLDETNSYAYRNLGIYHLQRGELTAARQQFDHAWTLDPDTDLLADYRQQVARRLAETAG
jgi:tetratricopeptide (TPR) repeat protein